MLESDTKRRGLAFLVCNYHKELKFIEKITKGSVTNKQMKQKLKADKTISSGLPLSNIPGIDTQTKLIEGMLKLPLYQEVEAEYKRFTATGKNQSILDANYLMEPPNMRSIGHSKLVPPRPS